MTPSDLDSINRRMAEALGYEYQQCSPDWSQWSCRSVADGLGWFKAPDDKSWTCAACYGFPPAYATDPTLTMPLMEAEKYISIYKKGDLFFIDLNAGRFIGEYSKDARVFRNKRLGVAFCLAYLARHEARRKP